MSADERLDNIDANFAVFEKGVRTMAEVVDRLKDNYQILLGRHETLSAVVAQLKPRIDVLEEKPDDHFTAIQSDSVSNSLLTRYSADEQSVIKSALADAGSTRKKGFMADSIRARILTWMDKHSKKAVVKGCLLYVEKGFAMEGKAENYLEGIIRGKEKELAAQSKRKVTQEASPAYKPATDNFVKINGIRFSKGEIMLWNRKGENRDIVRKARDLKPEWF